MFDVPPKEEKSPLHLNNVNRKENNTFIGLAAKRTQTEMRKFLIIHVKFDWPKTAKFRAKIKPGSHITVMVPAVVSKAE